MNGAQVSPIRYFVVDAFASRPFTGNPAAVVPLEKWPDDNWLQAVAMEMNLSETAYFVPNTDHFALRWFTPQVTLATAKVIGHLGLIKESTIVFSSRSGNLLAHRRPDGIALDFPLKPEQPSEPPAGLTDALRVEAKYIGRNQFDYLVEVESEAVVRSLAPDFKQLLAVDCRGVIVTARSSDPAFDFVSRFFAPAAGIDEDPVTGSAHCCLGDYWRKRLGKSRFRAYQASSRGGVVEVEVLGDRVLLGGQVIIFAHGELLQPEVQREGLNCVAAETCSLD
jgi:predicted PhzF superfamily epimerase YddE/YHI9